MGIPICRYRNSFTVRRGSVFHAPCLVKPFGLWGQVRCEGSCARDAQSRPGSGCWASSRARSQPRPGEGASEGTGGLGSPRVPYWTCTQRVDSLPKTGHTGRARRPDRPSTQCSRSGTHALGVERLPATCQEPLMPVPSIAFPTDPRERLPRQVWCRYPAPYRARPSPRSPQPPYPMS